ncbi:Fc.00g017230.m01.CDS01 [Cosmosporella sp. VM-42]
MQSSDRDIPREGDSYLRHQHSISSDQSSRSLVPMWDSSDPDRCPPPLPLNPQSPGGFSSRAGTSSAIQSAHAALNERAREAALAPTLYKRTYEASPERSPTKGNSHRRMQSLQPASVRDLSLMIEGTNGPNTSRARSPDKFDRPATPVRSNTDRSITESRHNDKDSNSSTPVPGPSLTPIVRPSVRRPPPQSILGENTPPQSSTMLALQNMGTPTKETESPLSNITNGSQALVKQTQNLDALSTQILSLTSIATSLQKEMSQLSRRSRDNATDLLSLKEATNTRDEDIRRSLRELLGSTNEGTNRISSRDPFGGLYLDNKPHNLSPSNQRAFQLPRIPSPKSFSDSIDRASISTPSLAGSEAPASIALLEKIIRDMGTKEGQESLLGRLIEVSNRLSGMATSAKVDELVEHLKSQAEKANSDIGKGTSRSRNYSFEDEHNQLELVREQSKNGPVTKRVEQIMKNEGRRNSEPPGRGSELLNDDLINIIRSVKDSVAQGGGLTAEVKALVRELRGEVLGMGREIGRRLEQQASRRTVDDHDSPSKDEVARVIDEGLEQMKDQLNHVLREHRRASAASVTSQKTNVDYQEIYNAMRAALRDNEATRGEMPDLSRDDVIEAVRDAWENYKPEIEVQQLGLERDEVLACLKEGLQEYAPKDERPPSATRDEVFTAVVEGLKHFVPPQVDTPATLSRDEIIDAVRDCLEEFEFPIAASAVGSNNDLTREDMVHAVKEGLHDLDISTSRALVTQSSNSDEVVNRLQEIMEYMRHEFKAVSEEAKENVAANGRDTEQVLDATKDGLEGLRQAIEGYVDRASGAAGQEEFLDDLLKSLDDFKDDIAALVSKSSEDSRGQLQTELEGLREVVNNSMVPAMPPPMPPQANNTEVMEALHTGFNNLRTEILRPRAETSEILDALNDGLNDLRAGMDRITNKPADLTANDEILDALKAGLDGVRSDIETIRDSSNEKAIATLDSAPEENILDVLKESLDAVRSDIETIRDNNEKAVTTVEQTPNDEILETMKAGLESVRSEVEALRDSNEKAVATVDEHDAHEELLDVLQTGLDSIRSDIEALRESTIEKAVAPIDETPNSDLLDALKSGIDSVRSDIESLRDSTNEKAVAAVETNTHDEILDAVKAGLESVRSEVEALRDSSNERALAAVVKDSEEEQSIVAADMLKQDDIKNLEVMIAELQVKVEAMEPEHDPIQKDDLARMEEMIRNVRDTVDEISTRDIPAVAVPKEKKEGDEETEVNGDDAASKDDVQAIETILRNTKAQLDELIDGEQAVRKDHVDNLETLLLETRESMGTVTTHVDTINTQMETFATHFETVSRKEDVATLESLITQITDSLDELKERAIKDSENPENVSKTDVEAVETVVLEIKTALDGIIASADFSTLASKEDVSSLEAIVKEFAEKLDTSVDSSTKAIEVRNAEMTGVGERVTEVKTFLEEFQGTIKSKLEEGSTGVESLSKLLETMGEKIDKNENIGEDLKEMFDTMKTEFEDSKTVAAGAKLESDEKFQEATTNLATKIDEKIDELVVKYDELQTMLDEKSKDNEARDVETEAAVVGTKAVADDLKLLVDTLGTTVTDSLEKMEEASMTVFTKMEDLVSKNEENHTEDKAEHQQTREQVTQALTLVESLKGEVGEHQPKILEAVKDLLLLVGEHFEHSKSSTMEIQDKIIENKPLEQLHQILPPEKYDNTEVHEKLDKLAELKYDDTEVRERLEQLAEDLKYDDSEVLEKLHKIIEDKYVDTEVLEKLDTLVEQKYDDTEVREKLDQLVEQKYDDAVVHEKLDKLVDHTSTADQAFSRLDTLDKVHASVVRTAADISEFLSSQTQRITDEHDDREKTLQETTVALERRLVEKDHIEASIFSLKDEEERLRQTVMSLRTEQESLIRQKTRLTGDVSSLETAMRLRKDELHDMESRAEHLERRILEGVMDHSRVLLMSKGNKGGDAMSRKRVRKSTNENEAPPQPARRSVMNMALQAKRNLAPPAQGGGSRRIVSLSQINNNVASGGFKRSQSVRTPAGSGKSYRKRSWGGDLDKGFGEHDKENVGMKETVEEVDEPENQLTIHPDSARAREMDLPGDDTTVLNSAVDDDGVDSDNETLRRSSRGTTVITSSTDLYTESEAGYSEYSDDRSDWTESAVGRESSIGTDGGDGNEMVVYGH